MCGPSGSGKTTLARELEAAGMERLSFDVELWRTGERPLTATRERLLEVDADLKARLVRLVREGRDVVLDLTFAGRAIRDEWRALVTPLGVVPETIYLDVPRDELVRRLTGRRDAEADDVVLTPEQIAAHLAAFEPPTSEEGPLTVLGPGSDGVAHPGAGGPDTSTH
ncbi:ATP-binding protein [Serinibacter arcticus]|uniref:ATP-binding protein n=2 Tax=Serinibacter arcticus TaxID=1655435 RepID=A0A2U2A007_9MICO|nr:ATP-binding protein [Serinibacter arcticus]